MVVFFALVFYIFVMPCNDHQWMNKESFLLLAIGMQYQDVIPVKIILIFDYFHINPYEYN